MNLKSKQKWLNFLDLYRKSGLSKPDFCKLHKFSVSKFYHYAKLHRELPVKSLVALRPAPKQSLFIPLSTKKEFKIKINESVSLTFEAAPDALWMASFIKSFGEHHASVR